MDNQQFEQYFQTTKQYALQIQEDPSVLASLLKYIEEQRNTYEQDPVCREFFKAEHYFFSGHYDHALKHYLQAKTIPNFQFFCFRASAYVALKRNQSEQAVKFASKALKIFPDDTASQLVLEHFSERSHQETEAEQESHHHISLGSEEFDELATIFEDNALVGAQQKKEAIAEHKAVSQHAFQSHSGLEQQSHLIEEILHNTILNTSETAQPETQQMEFHPRPSLFSLAEKSDAQATDALTRRLYALPPEEQTYTKEKQAMASHHETVTREGAFIEEQILDAEKALEQRLQLFQKQKADALNHYIQQAHARQKPLDNTLYILNGWEKEVSLTNRPRKNSTGFFIRWNGKGIAVNPGENFLENFHANGLHIYDIDYVVVTQNNPNAYAEVNQIYALNYQLNKISSELQIINYYLNQKALLELSHILKPNFKQERNAIHSLEIFVDSPDVEKIELAEGIALHYFPVSHPSSLGIRFELKHPGSLDRKAIRLGYISGAPWSPLLAHHLGSCDVLITGFGQTNMSDFTKLHYNEDSLGYLGTYSLLEEVKPRMLLCGEFAGQEGDIRMEAIKKMRVEFQKANQSTSGIHTILPADSGLFVNLKAFQVQCSVSKAWIDPSQIHVAKTAMTWGEFIVPFSCLLVIEVFGGGLGQLLVHRIDYATSKIQF